MFKKKENEPAAICSNSIWKEGHHEVVTPSRLEGSKTVATQIEKLVFDNFLLDVVPNFLLHNFFLHNFINRFPGFRKNNFRNSVFNPFQFDEQF